MSPAEIIGYITVPLLAVVVQLQRMLPVQRELIAGVRLLLQHFNLATPAPAPSSPARSSSSPAAAAANDAR